jgi:hypothetical protein
VTQANKAVVLEAFRTEICDYVPAQQTHTPTDPHTHSQVLTISHPSLTLSIIRLKNTGSKLLDCMRAVVAKGMTAYGYQHRVLMTGTPLQNNTGKWCVWCVWWLYGQLTCIIFSP